MHCQAAENKVKLKKIYDFRDGGFPEIGMQKNKNGKRERTDEIHDCVRYTWFGILLQTDD